MQIFTTDNAIEGGIARVKKEGKAYQNLVHRVAFSILKRGLDTKDFTKGAKQFTALVEAMPGATRTNALRDWVTAYAPLTWNSEENCFVYTSMKGFDPAGDMTEAKRTPFWEFSPEPEYKPVDWAKAIQSIVKRGERDLTELGEKSKVDQEQLDILRRLIEA